MDYDSENEGLDRIFEGLENLDNRLSRIEGALIGDKKMRVEGYLTKHNILAKQVKSNTERINKIFIYAGAIGASAALVFEVMINFVF